MVARVRIGVSETSYYAAETVLARQSDGEAEVNPVLMKYLNKQTGKGERRK
jgi:hypothetical protein